MAVIRCDECFSKGRLVGWAVLASFAASSVGCAHSTGSDRQSAQAKKIQKLETRVEDLEKTKGRLSVRLDEMEDEVFLLQDRVEAHRLALERRGRMEDRTGDRSRAKAPEPTPQTNYGGQRTRRSDRERFPVRGESGHSPREGRKSRTRSRGTKIPLSRQQARGEPRESASGQSNSRPESRPETPEETKNSGDRSEGNEESSGGEIVITNEEFREFASRAGDGNETSSESAPTESSGADAPPSRGGDANAKRPVTDEKLPTDGRTSSTPSERAPERSDGEDPEHSDPFSGKSGLDLYKTALAKYRTGEFSTALSGFKRFLSSGPRSDYRDNGLYWVGECHFGLGNFEQSVDYFQRILEEEPDGNKVPDAMLKMALAFREMGMEDRARRKLQELTDKYPSTNAGRIGEKKLSELES